MSVFDGSSKFSLAQLLGRAK